MNYREWLSEVPSEISGDPLWKMEVYRLALFAADVAWIDVTRLPMLDATRNTQHAPASLNA